MADKNLKTLTLKSLSFFFVCSLVTATASAQKSTEPAAPTPAPKIIEKKAIVLEYMSWFETLKLKGPGVSTEISTLFYGTGLLYDFTSYQNGWGYGSNVGLAQGFGGAGNSLSTGTYSQTRVQWQALRAGGRIFKLYGNRVELGASAALFYKSITWPVNSLGNAPVNSTNPTAGFFLESRWRLSKRWELEQAAGGFNISSSMAWRLGVGYAL